MSELPSLITDLALILVVAGIVTLVFKKLKQPLVLGYLVAGILVGPHTTFMLSVADKENVELWAQIGILFLLFSLGLDFSFKKIVKMGMAPIIACITIIFCMMLLGFCVGKAFGWGQMDCVFLGGMLAMSSTTIIYKAFDDMGIRQQQFASLVMSVLILEDILAIVMMVMLSAIAGGGQTDSSQLLGSVLKIGFFLILWFVVGIFAIPIFLRSVKKLMTAETLVIVSLGLCFLMAVISTKVGFSSAFGAFVMGSILAETVEAEKIEKLVTPVEDLFGAVFFVSVGMLVDPKILLEYAGPIAILVLTILIGQAIFGSLGYLLSGQSLKSAMRCGFSMAQIGEFSFIIATLGLSLGVIGEFLYPVIVAVSVITTFLTPYMIKAAIPAYNFLEKRLPKSWITTLNTLTMTKEEKPHDENKWKKYLLNVIGIMVVYSILCVAVIFVMINFFHPFAKSLMPENWAAWVTAILTLLFILPFLRAMLRKKTKGTTAKSLIEDRHMNQLPLVFIALARIVIASSFIFYIGQKLIHPSLAILLAAIFIIVCIVWNSDLLKKENKKLEELFVKNLQSRDVAAQLSGKKKPVFEGELLDRNLHITDFEVPVDSKWTGKRLRDLSFRQNYGVQVSSILRGGNRINIPSGNDIVIPLDKLQVIGNDEQLTKFNKAITTEVIESDGDPDQHIMKLRTIKLPEGSPLVGKTLKDSGLREKYGCMLVGIEEGQKELTPATPGYVFEEGDLIWVVGEEADLKRIENAGPQDPEAETA